MIFSATIISWGHKIFNKFHLFKSRVKNNKNLQCASVLSRFRPPRRDFQQQCPQLMTVADNIMTFVLNKFFRNSSAI